MYKFFKFIQPAYSIANRGGLYNLQYNSFQIYYITNTLHYNKIQKKFRFCEDEILLKISWQV